MEWLTAYDKRTEPRCAADSTRGGGGVGRGRKLDRALKQFKRICNDAGIFKEIKRSTYYEKPSERRRREMKQREKNIRNIGKKKVKKVYR